MIKLNRKVEYALIALKFMSTKCAGQLTTAKEVCAATGAPFDATARVMQIMAQHQLLKSEQGAYGGYLLIKDLSRVSFYELMEMIVGRLDVVKCLHTSMEGQCHLAGHCNIKGPVGWLNSKLMDFYSNLTLSELLKDTHSKWPAARGG